MYFHIFFFSNCAGDWQHHSQQAKVPVLHMASKLLLRLTEGELNLPFNIGDKETVHMPTETRHEGRNKSQAEESSAGGISDTRLFMIIRNI